LKLNGVAKAKPIFAPQIAMPKTFKLIIRNDDLEVDCKLSWQDGESLGVEFMTAFRRCR